ncbi:MAG: hypothetical protein QOI78_1346 [Actinomycetota bacterium]|nr:hypothetical protein [Actinomycetota bacterium]
MVDGVLCAAGAAIVPPAACGLSFTDSAAPGRCD